MTHLPHPAILLDATSPQLAAVIDGMEAGTYPLPDDAIWRDDLPRDLAVRLAKATGATDAQIAGVETIEPEEVHPVTITEETSAVEATKGTIEIRHTHEDGTLIYGSRKGDGVYELIGPRTAARFRWFPSIRQMGIQQSRERPAKRWQINAAEKALREAGWDVTVDIDDTPMAVEDARAAQDERLDERYDRLTARAQKHASEAQSRSSAAHAISERFAGGQPILVGHHSERRARKDHERMDNHQRAANQAHRKAEYASQAAASVGSQAAYRDRPGTVRRRIAKTTAELAKIARQIKGTQHPAYDRDEETGKWRISLTPASGDWLAQLEANREFLTGQLEHDQATIAAYEAEGYVLLDRTKVHKGDVVTWAVSYRGIPPDEATITRVNPKTVTLDRTRWPRKVGYEQIKTVQCPHEGTTITVTAKRPKPAEREAAELPAFEPPPPVPEPVTVHASAECFVTPPDVVARMLAVAAPVRGMAVLEPSAGPGGIARAAVELGAVVDCVELVPHLAERLADSGRYRNVRGTDFLLIEPSPEYDRVLMNPPFSKGQDVRHVMHALGFVKPGGLLVAIMGAGAEFRTDKATVAFRELVEARGGWIEKLPDGAFSVETSNTNVRTVMAVIPGPEGR